MDAKKRYDKLVSARSNYLTRAEDASKLTIPQLYTGQYEAENDGNTYHVNVLSLDKL